jgi:heptaprenyl diphosphate synthase
MTVTTSTRPDVEDVLATAARTGVDWLDDAVSRAILRPAKRLRPRLLISTARCGGGTGDAVVRAAAAIELLHLGSLVHDDLMDGSAERGGLPAMHEEFGPARAVVGGDWLIAVGGRLLADLGVRVVGAWHQAYADMCSGQAREAANAGRLISIEEYKRTIAGKTAALFRAACTIGARCGGLPDQMVAACGTYGEHLGLMFQIVDDLMDVVSTDALWRKPVRQDVPRGVYTLPVLIAADRDGQIQADLAAGHHSGSALERIYRAAAAIGAAPTVATARSHAAWAAEALELLPPSDDRRELCELPGRYLRSCLADRVAPEYSYGADLDRLRLVPGSGTDT